MPYDGVSIVIIQIIVYVRNCRHVIHYIVTIDFIVRELFDWYCIVLHIMIRDVILEFFKNIFICNKNCSTIVFCNNIVLIEWIQIVTGDKPPFQN